MVTESRETFGWYLKNSRDQYICEGGKIRKDTPYLRTHLMFDSMETALEYRKINRRKSFHPEEVIHIHYNDSTNHPRTVVTFEEITVMHRQSDEE
ncbi:MAG: hypothetical protein Unbinned6046contig1000_73 [Prokaryotic dsDNA virus sp.]|nr:MAG: hypothetical protein Unbinned6046contig1000_73 [Prokaryotic dsDNA virus sp.]|tara:strand:+ start:70 stop:354 length:285 start_codon:yes stop_codon:yes gene_type:complete